MEAGDRQYILDLLASHNAFVKVAPKVISMLDYTKGCGHTRLVTVSGHCGSA